jgi:hypothetical protein
LLTILFCTTFFPFVFSSLKMYVDIDLSGTPPFTLQYSFEGKQFTDTTSSHAFVFSTSKEGIFQLDELSDFYNYSVRPGLTKVVKFVSAPRVSISGPEFSCQNAELNVALQLTGSPPFKVEYQLRITWFYFGFYFGFILIIYFGFILSIYFCFIFRLYFLRKCFQGNDSFMVFCRASLT